jgi:hypothetical protein
VFFSGVGGDLVDDVQVTAFGGTTSECRVDEWSPSGGGQSIDVECYDTNGGPSRRLLHDPVHALNCSELGASFRFGGRST